MHIGNLLSTVNKFTPLLRVCATILVLFLFDSCNVVVFDVDDFSRFGFSGGRSRACGYP